MDKSPLGQFLKAERLAMGLLKRGSVARTIMPDATPKQIGRLGHRIYLLEEHGQTNPELLTQVAEVLGVDDATLDRLAQAENQFRQEQHRRYVAEFNRWTDQPVKPYGVVRAMACVYGSFDLPAGITQEQGEALVAAKARQTRCQCALVWNRRLTVFFRESGELWHRAESTPERDYHPFVRVRGKRFLPRLKPP